MLPITRPEEFHLALSKVSGGQAKPNKAVDVVDDAPKQACEQLIFHDACQVGIIPSARQAFDRARRS
jgi:hypothetical protein